MGAHINRPDRSLDPLANRHDVRRVDAGASMATRPILPFCLVARAVDSSLQQMAMVRGRQIRSGGKSGNDPDWRPQAARVRPVCPRSMSSGRFQIRPCPRPAGLSPFRPRSLNSTGRSRRTQPFARDDDDRTGRQFGRQLAQHAHRHHAGRATDRHHGESRDSR